MCLKMLHKTGSVPSVHWTLGQLSTSNQVQVAIVTIECCSRVTLAWAQHGPTNINSPTITPRAKDMNQASSHPILLHFTSKNNKKWKLIKVDLRNYSIDRPKTRNTQRQNREAVPSARIAAKASFVPLMHCTSLSWSVTLLSPPESASPRVATLPSAGVAAQSGSPQLQQHHLPK